MKKNDDDFWMAFVAGWVLGFLILVLWLIL